MKRIELATLAYPTPSSLPETSTNVYAAHVAESVSEEVRHSLLYPLHYEKNYAYPLVVWLHGAGDNERQMKRVMPLVSLRNYVAIAPRGTIEDECEGAYRWRQSERDILEAQWRISRCIEIAQRACHVNSERIFIGGYADGGTMALRLALRMPHVFAGAFTIGGGMPQTHQPLINIDLARGFPLLVAQANASRRFTTSRLCEDLRVLHAAGMSVCVRQYPAGDELTTAMLSDVDAWLMERVTGQTRQADEVAPDARDWN